MCPVHWATFAFGAVPAALSFVGYAGLRARQPRRRDDAKRVKDN